MGKQNEVLILTRVPEPELGKFIYPIIPIIPKPFPGGMSTQIWGHIEKILEKKFEVDPKIKERIQKLPPDDPRGGRRFFHIHFQEGILPLDVDEFKDVFIKATTQMLENMDESLDYGGFLDIISTMAIDTVPLPE